MSNTHNQPFSQVLQTAQLIDQIISSWTPQQVENWATSNPQSVELVINDYGYCLITHPEFGQASPQDQQAAQDVFRSHMENFGQYVNPQTLETILVDLAFLGNIDGVSAIIDNITDDQELSVSPGNWAQIIQLTADAPFINPEATQTEANALVRDIMEGLADNQFADIAQLVDISQLGNTMINVGFNGNIEAIDAIADNLSDDAQLQIGSFTWAQVIQQVTDAPFIDPSVTQAASNALVRELMEGLADNQFADIAQLVDISQLGNTMINVGFNGNIEAIDAIADNLSDDAQLQIGSFTWAQVIQQVTDAPFIDPSVTQAASNALVRELMEGLADNQFADIAQLVDISQLGNTMINVGFNGNIEAIDAIADNLSDDAQLQIGSFTWAQVIQQVTDAPFIDPSVTQAASNALVRELMEGLADNQFADIAQLVDISQLGNTMINVGFNGNIEAIDAIADNLSDDAQLQIGSFTWAQVIQQVTDAPFIDPSVTQAASNALVRELMEGLADNQFADIAQLVDISQLGNTMINVGFNGNIEAIDAIADNLSDDAELIVGPQSWGQIISDISFAPFFNPEVTQADADALIREIMERLADNQFADIAQIVDINQLAFAMSNAAAGGLLETVDAIADNLSDDAELIVGPQSWGQIISDISFAPFFNPEVTQAEANAQVREIMTDLASNTLADIAQIVDVPALNYTVQSQAQNDNFEVVDAILDNLSDSALLSIDTVALESMGVDVGTSLNDTLWDSAGNFEALYGLGGDDYVIGGNGNTSLYGGDGTDYVYDFGGADDDVISGGDGADYLYGAGGADSFVFYEGETGVDTVWVFNSAEGDRLNINDYLDQYDSTQHAIEDFVILTEANGSTTVSVDVDGQGAGGSQDLALLNGVTGLDIDDVIDTSAFV